MSPAFSTTCFLSAATIAPLPNEILFLVCRLLGPEDLRSWACASQALWQVANTLLWRNINSMGQFSSLLLSVASADGRSRELGGVSATRPGAANNIPVSEVEHRRLL